MHPEPTVTIVSSKGPAAYPSHSPCHPHEAYPELIGRVPQGEEGNLVYALCRQLLWELGMDAAHFSRPEWNPLGELIRPGQKVLVKPNLVRHIHLTGGDYNAVVTHASLIRCVLDYVAIALQGRGEITVGDAPVQSSVFARTVERTGLQQVCSDVADIWKIPVRLLDFRLRSVCLDESHKVISEEALQGDASGYCRVDLGKRSLLFPLADQSDRFRVTNYESHEMAKHHNRSVNEYLIPRTVLESDVVINLPKLKTHRKVGLTAALKNLVGINGHKDWLPHHRFGSLKEGGDEYLHSSFLKRTETALIEAIDRSSFSIWTPLRRFLARGIGALAHFVTSDSFVEGSWYGNDTLWRTVLDLNRLLKYADRAGTMTEDPQRRWLTIVDGVIAGEGEGPMEPTSRPCGILVGGMNPVAVDAVLATMIGFDYRKIPLIVNAFEVSDWPLLDFGPDDITIRSQDPRWRPLRVGELCDVLSFAPASGWSGHVEFSEGQAR